MSSSQPKAVFAFDFKPRPASVSLPGLHYKDLTQAGYVLTEAQNDGVWYILQFKDQQRGSYFTVQGGSYLEALSRAREYLYDQGMLASTNDASSPDDLRAQGWTVGVHNDYRLNGVAHTFWLFTKGRACVKGEGRSDAEALNQVRQELAQRAAQVDMFQHVLNLQPQFVPNHQPGDPA